MNPELPELLCPAGSMAHLQTALTYGADAVYLGGNELNLRSKARGFSFDELLEAVSLTRKHGSRTYYCLNALPLQKDIPRALSQLEVVSELNPDGLIVADPGIVYLAREKIPGVDLHLSTQANTCNSYCIEFWKEQGVKRVNLSRELSLKDVRAISGKVRDIELEMFVHGAMCMAISGRCFLSAHLNQRSANQGLCAHPCRYDYKPYPLDFEEKTRPGFPVWSVEQGEDYSKIFSAEDLCLVKYIPWLINNSIHSLKIEGRTKSVSYLAIVTDVYRTALDDFARKTFRPARYLKELSLINNRPMGTGFFLKNKLLFTDPQNKPANNKKILARVLQKTGSSRWLVQIKEKWLCSMDVELVLPGLRRPSISRGNYSLENHSGQKTQTAHSGMTATLCCEHEQIRENIFIRMK
ncbi:MAG: peptidase U32 family protein [Desulfonatronovibrio sp.]